MRSVRAFVLTAVTLGAVATGCTRPTGLCSSSTDCAEGESCSDVTHRCASPSLLDLAPAAPDQSTEPMLALLPPTAYGAPISSYGVAVGDAAAN